MLEDDTVKQEHSYGAVVERGEIVSVSSDAYTVRSLDRSGIIPLPTTTIGLETYSVGDIVYFFVFGDGTGRILSKVEQSSKIVPDGSITSEKLDAGFITELDESASGDDTDLLVVGYRGASALKKFTLANLVAFAKTKIASLLRDGAIGSVSVDFNDLADGWRQIDASTAVSNAPVTGRQTGIILQTSNTAGAGTKYQVYAAAGGNELWQRTCWYGTWYSWQRIYGKSTASVATGSYGMSSAKFVRHGNVVMVQFGGTPSGLTTGWKQVIQIPAGFIPTETRTPYATLIPQNGGFQPFVVCATSAGYIEINPTYVQVTGFVNALYTYYVD